MEQIELGQRRKNCRLPKAPAAQTVKRHGLKEGQLKITDRILVEIIQKYTLRGRSQEPERTIATVCRKAAKEVIEGKEEITLTTALSQILSGPEKYCHGQKDEQDEVGSHRPCLDRGRGAAEDRSDSGAW